MKILPSHENKNCTLAQTLKLGIKIHSEIFSPYFTRNSEGIDHVNISCQLVNTGGAHNMFEKDEKR